MTEAQSTEQERREFVEKQMLGDPQLRAMFACWAPEEIPHWFQVAPQTKRPQPIREPDGFTGERIVNQQALDEWDLLERINRYFQWRWFYADRMLEWAAKSRS